MLFEPIHGLTQKKGKILQSYRFHFIIAMLLEHFGLHEEAKKSI
jgi:hypothetical protein